MPPIKQIDRTNINDYQAWKISADSILSRLNCHNIGKIIEFDPQTQLCTVELMQIKQYGDKYYQPVPITQVPLIIYGTQNSYITLPDPTGAICLLLFLDRNIENFKLTGEKYTPETTRMHDFSDCVALTTFKTLADSIEDYDETSIKINYQNANIKIKDEIEINSTGDMIINSPTKIVLNTPEAETIGSLNVGNGSTGIVPCGAATLQITNGIITGVS